MATTTPEKLRALIRSGHAQRDTVRWGRGYRDVIMLGGKKYQYEEGTAISRTLKSNKYSMYIDMPATSSNQNIVIDDILSGDVGEGDRLTRRQRIERRKMPKPFNALTYVTNKMLNKDGVDRYKSQDYIYKSK